jgi:flagellar biosynthesis GTPase FlhF
LHCSTKKKEINLEDNFKLKKMKLSLAFASVALGQNVCQKCDENIADFNSWHKNENVICSRYTDPRFQDFERGACKECKIQCVPTEESCPGVNELEAGFWNRTGKKLTAQYIERAEKMAAERALARKENSFAKEMAKYERITKKQEEREAKAANKAWKQASWEEWRENRRLENEAKRAAKKQEKKERKAAAKAAKELRKQMREQKRFLADQNKTLFAWYADLEEHYHTVCPDMFLIKDNAVQRSYQKYLSNVSE